MSLLDAKSVYKPFAYPWAYDAWLTQQRIHWLPEEVPLADDVKDWQAKLSDAEKNLLTQIFRFFTQSDIGVVPRLLGLFGYDYNVSLNSADAWLTIFVLDVWHWTPLVALLAFAGLQAIPPAYLRAAQIDGASSWKTFRYVTS